MKRQTPINDQLDLLGGPPPVFVKNPVWGYAARPGSGPAGETCKTCACSYAVRYSRNYWKCSLVKATGGPGSDIRLKSPACSQWRPEESSDGTRAEKPAERRQ